MISRRPLGCWHRIQPAVELQRELVQRVAHVSQPLGALDHAIEQIAVNDSQPAAIGGFVHPVFGHLDATEVTAQQGQIALHYFGGCEAHVTLAWP